MRVCQKIFKLRAAYNLGTDRRSIHVHKCDGQVQNMPPQFYAGGGLKMICNRCTMMKTRINNESPIIGIIHLLYIAVYTCICHNHRFDLNGV